MKTLLSLLLALVLWSPSMGGEELTDEEWTATARAAMIRLQEVIPEAGQPGTFFHDRIIEIDQEWEASGDARYDDPEKSIVIARIVLQELEVIRTKMARAEKRRAVASARPAAPRPAPMNMDELGDSAETFGGPRRQAAPSGTIVSPDGVSNYWQTKDGAVKVSGPGGLTTIYQN